MLEIFTHIITLLAGLAGGFALKVVIDAKKVQTTSTAHSPNSQGVVNQTGNTVGGHMAGRDVKTDKS